MKKAKLFLFHFKTIIISMFCFSLFLSCAGQLEKNELPLKIKLEQFKIHGDSISMKAETLPEYKISPHDKESQGYQISGVVRTVFQDSKGNFWFGTQDGLCRKDKNGVVYFSIKNLNVNGITVHVILEDKAGNIWIGYNNGIAKYDGEFFTNYYVNYIQMFGGLWSMIMDAEGTLWIGTTQGVFTFDGTALTSFEIPEGKVNPNMGVSTSKMIHSITEDSKGNMWFATNGGAYMFDGKALINISAKDKFLSNFVNQIIESSNGNYLVSTANGLFRYDGNSFYNLTEKLLGENEGIGYIFEDINGTIWFTANKRDIYSYNGETFQKIQIKKGKFSPLPFQIYQDQQNRLWFVGFKGAYRLENNAFVNVTRFGPW